MNVTDSRVELTGIKPKGDGNIELGELEVTPRPLPKNFLPLSRVAFILFFLFSTLTIIQQHRKIQALENELLTTQQEVRNQVSWRKLEAATFSQIIQKIQELTAQKKFKRGA